MAFRLRAAANTLATKSKLSGARTSTSAPSCNASASGRRAAAAVLPPVYVGAAIKKHLDYLDVAARGRTMERLDAHRIARDGIWVGGAIEQDPDHFAPAEK